MENSKKSSTLCVLAFILGLLMATTLGCSATNETKVHSGSKTYAGAVGIGIRAEGE